MARRIDIANQVNLIGHKQIEKAIEDLILSTALLDLAAAIV